MKNTIQEKLLLYKVQLKKDTDAFAALYDIYIDKIYRFVSFKVGHKQEAEDITSQVFLKTWKYLTADDQKNVSSFSGLLYTIARNSIIDYYRRRATRQEEGIDDVRIVDDSAQERIETNHDIAILIEHIQKLKQEYQEVIILRYIENFPISQIAEIVGKKQTAVRVTIHRATKVLKSMMDTSHEPKD